MMADVCLPLIKYSYADGQTADGIAWTHMSAADLFVIVKGGDGQNGSLTMKVVHATSTLESIDIAAYIDVATRLRKQAEMVNSTARIEQLPIFGLAKGNALALRYRPQDCQARRVQIRLHDETACQDIVAILTRRGMVFQTQRPGTARPNTAATCRETAQSDERPITVCATSPFFPQDSQASRQNPFQLPTMEAGSLSKRPTTSNYNMPPPRSRGEPSVAQEAALDGVKMSQPWLSHTSRCHRPNSETHAENTKERRSSASDVATSETLRQASSKHNISLTDDNSMRLPGASGQQGQHGSSKDSESRILPFMSSDFGERPLTAVSRTSVSSALDLPPLQKPKLAKDRSLASKTEPDVHHDTTVDSDQSGSVMPAVRPTEVCYGGRASITDNATRCNDGGIFSKLAPMAVSAKPLPMSDVPSNRKTLSELSRNSNILPLDSLHNVPHELESPPDGSKGLRTDENGAPFSRTSQKVDIGSIAQVCNSSRPPADSAMAENLDEYAAQSPEDRLAALEQFMLANLEHPAFTTLCEDVEQSWRRLALGL